MTRINSAISPLLLTDEHLLAEHREIKRIPNIFKKRTNTSGVIPNKFTLGKGHVLYFIDKPDFTLSRYNAVRKECLNRGFNIEDYSSNWDSYIGFKGEEHKHTPEEKFFLVERITERILNSPKQFWHYKGEKISKEEAVYLLKNNNE